MEKLKTNTEKSFKIRDLGKLVFNRLFSDDGWAGLPKTIQTPEPFYAAEEHSRWVICDRPEDGYRKEPW